LNPGSNLPGAHIIKVGDVLAKDCFQIVFTNTLAVDLASVDPDALIGECTDKQSYGWND